MVNLEQATWRKSSHSTNGACVEVAFVEDTVAVRDSKDLRAKDRSHRILTFSEVEWNAFLDGVRAGEFDLP